jgi:hypothetical protein
VSSYFPLGGTNARGKKNGKELKFVALEVGSNYLLEKKRVAYSPNYPYISLAARASAACDTACNPLLCRRQDSNLHARLRAHASEASLSASSNTSANSHII